MRSTKYLKRLRVRLGIRKRVSGTSARPRLSVYKSNRAIYAQLIDDEAGRTLASSASVPVAAGAKKKSNCEVASKVGASLAAAAKKVKIKEVVFDRNGWPYHGKLKALADGARKGGLVF